LPACLPAVGRVAFDGSTLRCRATPEPERGVREKTFSKLYGITAALILGCLGSLPAQAQFHGTGCAGQYDISGNAFFTAATLLIPNVVQPGDYVGPWHGRVIHNEGWNSSGDPFTFSVCTDTGQVHSGGTTSRLIPVGARAPGVNPEPLPFVTDDGYSVYTNTQLQSAGLGFAVRWKASNRWGDEGDWVSPSGTWTGEVFEQSKGLPFWRWTVTRHTNAYAVQGRGQPKNVFLSLSDWNLFLEEYPNPPNDGLWGGYFGIHYDAWVEVRYVAIGPSPQQYDPINNTLTLNIVRMLAMPVRRLRADGWLMRHAINVKRMPHGTCKTPSGADTFVRTVGFNVHMSELYGDGSGVGTTSQPTDFELTFEVINAAQGVIGLDSTPGNAQGVGIQLRHRGGWFGNAPVQLNQPEDGESGQVYWRSWDTGINTDQGVTHTIPLSAAVYRTGNVIPGKINASILVFIQYK